MQQVNNKFSFSRVKDLARLDLQSNWKTYALGAVSVFAALFIINFICMNLASGSYTDVFSTWMFMLAFSLFAFSIYFIVVLSTIMQPMSTKEKRINFLMLPATNLEKFVWRLFLVTVLSTVAFVVAFLLAEVVRLATLPLFELRDVFCRFSVAYIAEQLSSIDVNENVTQGASYWMASTFWSFSIYVLGGCFWYKKAFFKTVAVCIAVFVLWMICGVLGLGIPLALTSSMSMTTVAVIQLLFGCFNLWLSYRLFTRSQVIIPKDITRR